MTWEKHANTPYHQQDTDYYCGAAVAQMILDSIGAGVLDQNTLYNSNHSHSASGWYTSPDGLNYTLNNLMPPPPTFNSYFIKSVNNTEPDGSSEIVRTLYYFGVATGTLVYGCGHWIAVRGVKTDVEPKYGSTYSILGFWINNPWPPTPSFYNSALAPPPPHADPDACGAGGNRGIANEYVDYASLWRSTYFTGCGAQFISIADPRRPDMGTLQVRSQERPMSGEQIISPAQASELVTRGLQMHEISREERVAVALRETRHGRPTLVQRLDLPDTFYYIVPLVRGEQVTALAAIDALYGTFNGIQINPEPSRFHIIPREDALTRAQKGMLELGGRLGRFPLRENAFCFYPIMVWRPCWESRSPYYPFYQITVGTNHIYVGYNGIVYPELHDLGLG